MVLASGARKFYCSEKSRRRDLAKFRERRTGFDVGLEYEMKIGAVLGAVMFS